MRKYIKVWHFYSIRENRKVKVFANMDTWPNTDHYTDPNFSRESKSSEQLVCVCVCVYVCVCVCVCMCVCERDFLVSWISSFKDK